MSTPSSKISFRKRKNARKPSESELIVSLISLGGVLLIVKNNFFTPGLIREKQDLKRLLKEDANEVTKDVPLHTLQMNIDESLKVLREKLKARHEEIAMLLSDQEELCNGENCSVRD